MATTSRTQNLTDFDTRLLELAHQLDAERREIVMKFAQDLLQIPYEPELESSEPELAPQLLH